MAIVATGNISSSVSATGSFGVLRTNQITENKDYVEFFTGGNPWKFEHAWTGVINHASNPVFQVNAGSNGTVAIPGNRQVSISGVTDIGSSKMKFTPNSTSGNVIDMY